MITAMYDKMLENIRERIVSSDCFSPEASDTDLTKLCNDVGRLAYESLKEDENAEETMEKICHELQHHYPGAEGFQVTIVVLMKEFYLEFQKNESLSSLVEQLDWEQNLTLIQTFADLNEREFYMRMSTSSHWSHDQLTAHIDNETYLKCHAGTVFSDSSQKQEHKHKWITEDANVKEFTQMSAKALYQKRNIIKKITDNLVNPLSPYALMGEKFNLEDELLSYSIDLLFYNRALNAIMIFEIKCEKFRPDYADTMQHYLQLINSKIKLENEKPAIGIILCADENKIQTHYIINSLTGQANETVYASVDELTGEFLENLPKKSLFEQMIDEINQC